ncbi:AMP-binding protein, partial [Mycobacterium simulans]|uniref:AMP-binding protein n=1 Tax=Mycobacterium simulans TaxID=627089 RepID=UPI001749DE33
MQSENVARFLAERSLEAGRRDSPAFYAPNPVTHGQIHDGALRLATVLTRHGLSRGDRLLLCLPDSLDLVQLLLASLARGILVFIANPELRPEDHAFVERDTEPALVVTSGALHGRFQRSTVVDPAELLSDATRAEPADFENLSGDAVAYATYTSGTTGPPKAAVHRHADVFTYVDAMCRTALRLAPEDVGLSSARMYFAYGLGNSVWFPLATGSSAVINSSPISSEVAAKLCERYRPSVLYGVPTFFARVVDTCFPDSFQSLRCIVSAGEALEFSLAERLMEFFGGIPILDGIGSTEVGQTFVSNTVDEWRIGTLGKVLPPYEIRVVAPDGTTAGPGVEGNLWVQGPSIAAGYWNRPNTPLSMNGSWLDTGDRVFIDPDGWIRYGCRADDIEIVGGININPNEVERLILEDDCVAEAAVVGVRESTGASALQAFLVPKRGTSLDDSAIAEIYRRLRNQLSSFKVPHRFAIAQQLPRTASGKLMRGDLRAESPTKPIWQVSSMPPPSNIEAEPDKTSAANIETSDRNRRGMKLHEQLNVLRQQRYQLLADTVGRQVAMMLGQSNARSLDTELAFSELGFNSQMTVELRNRLAAATGLQLPDTVGWDYGSISELATYLEAELSGRASPMAALPAPARVDEPIAVVGMACRLPGGVDSAQALWDLVSGGVDAVGGFPTDRGWDLAGLFDPDPDAVGKTYTRSGAFLADAAGFDAEFFGISAREATAMDPQQRLLLEVCWEALETAGIDPTTLEGSNTGVFAGAWAQPGAAGADGAEGYGLTGVATSVASGRVAYVLGLQGP